MMKPIISQIRKNIVVIGLFVLFFALSASKLSFYFRFDFNLILVFLALPFVIRKTDNRKSSRYGIISILMFLLYPFTGISTIYFLGFISALFFLYESNYGRLSVLPLFLVLIVSPILVFIFEVVGFEIRFYLTEAAAVLLRFFDSNYTATGNIICLNGENFHIDPECMGLNSTIISLYSAIIMISFIQKKRKSKVSVIYVLTMLGFTFALVVIANLFRIVIITLFRSMPGTVGHEIIGIICFIVYVLLPLYFIIKASISRKEVLPVENDKPVKNYYLPIILTSIIIIQMIVYLLLNTSKEMPFEPKNPILLKQGYQYTESNDGVGKYEDKECLIYIKPANKYFSADHTPVMCWKGSGYKQTNESIVQLEKSKVYYSELIKGKDTLYSCWWYDSGDDKTISQFRWRFESLKSDKKYRVVNVVSYDEKIMLTKVKHILDSDIFRH